MDGSAVKEIAGLAADATWFEKDGEMFSPLPLKPVFHDPQPEPLYVNTLEGFIHYIEINVDKLKLEDFLVHVNEPCEVNFWGELKGPNLRRWRPVVAHISRPAERMFARYMPVEEFIVTLGANFTDAGDKADLLAFLSKIDMKSEVVVADDGISQNVTVNKGVSGALKERKERSPLVVLAPHRTFPEVEQPVSQFLFRMKQEEKAGPQCALFEADNGFWKVQAKRSIRDYIRKEISDIAVII